MKQIQLSLLYTFLTFITTFIKNKNLINRKMAIGVTLLSCVSCEYPSTDSGISCYSEQAPYGNLPEVDTATTQDTITVAEPEVDCYGAAYEPYEYAYVNNIIFDSITQTYHSVVTDSINLSLFIFKGTRFAYAITDTTLCEIYLQGIIDADTTEGINRKIAIDSLPNSVDAVVFKYLFTDSTFSFKTDTTDFINWNGTGITHIERNTYETDETIVTL